MKIWILASVASFILLRGDVWGMDIEKQAPSERRENLDTEKKGSAPITEDTFDAFLKGKETWGADSISETITRHNKLIGQAKAEARDAGIKDYCPNLRLAKDNDFIKILLEYTKKKIEKFEKKSKTMDHKGGKKTIKGKSALTEIGIDEKLINTSGVKYLTGQRRKYDRVFRLQAEKHLLPWEGDVITAGKVSRQKTLFGEDAYWKTIEESPESEGKIALYDTFNITGIDFPQFIEKIDFTPKEDRVPSKENKSSNAKDSNKAANGKPKTWKDLPIRKRQTAMLICDMPGKTNCQNLEGWKKNIKGCAFTKIKRCLDQAPLPESKWLTEMLGDYFDYSMGRMYETGRSKQISDTAKTIEFAEFYALIFQRFAPKSEGDSAEFIKGQTKSEHAYIIDPQNPKYKLAKENFVANPTIRRNAVYALVLNEASKRHIDQTGKLEDKAFLKEQLTLLLQDAGEIIAQIQYKRQEVNSGLGNLIGSGDMDSMSHVILKDIIKTKVKELHEAEAAKGTGTPDSGKPKSAGTDSGTKGPSAKDEE